MGEKTEFVTYLKGVYYDALFLTLWNLRNFKFVRNLATVDVLGCDNNHPFLPTCCEFTTRRFWDLFHIGVGSMLLVQTNWAISGPQSVGRAAGTDSTLFFCMYNVINLTKTISQ